MSPSRPKGKKFDEDIQMLAEDQLRMGIARTQNMDPPEPYAAESTKAILVVGGGMTGMTSALEAARAGYEIVLVEKEPVSRRIRHKVVQAIPEGRSLPGAGAHRTTGR